VEDSEKKRLEDDDRRYVWHPFTQMKEWEAAPPLIIEEGSGTYLTDIYGRRYLDGVSSLWVNIHGHRKKELDEALISQIKKISHSTLLGLSNVPSIKLASMLAERAPSGLVRVFYSDNGSTGIEIAVKIGFQFWQQHPGGHKGKTKFISLVNAYHGDTIGSVSLGGIDLFHSLYKPLLFNSLKVSSPYCYRCHLGLKYPSCLMACLDGIEQIMKKHSGETAAFVIEPLVQAAAGMIVSPPGFLKKVRELCTRYNILMIADEVATGFGRTGCMFACEHENVSPDLMVISKGLTGGYLPLAATLTTKEVYDVFLGEYDEFKTFLHGHSYTGNPLGCAVAIANLNLFDSEDVLGGIKDKVIFLEERLRAFDGLQHVGDVRNKGLMVGIELVMDRSTKKPYPLSLRIGTKVGISAREKGLLIRPLGNVVVLMPPLSVTINELEAMVKITMDSILEVTERSCLS
jgi:adenosylmethionine-8-amino-7-oxononanoate aminotransferase